MRAYQKTEAQHLFEDFVFNQQMYFFPHSVVAGVAEHTPTSTFIIIDIYLYEAANQSKGARIYTSKLFIQKTYKYNGSK